MTFPKCAQVLLFLVLLCLSTFCCAHRVLTDHTDDEKPNHAHSQGTAMNEGHGGGGGGGGMSGSGAYGGSQSSGSGFGARYPPPAGGGGGGGGGWGWGWGSCGGGATPPCGGSCYPSPQPVTCPAGCQPALPHMGHWGYMPIQAMNYMDHIQPQSAHMSHSSQSKVDMHGAEAETSTMQNKKVKEHAEIWPSEKEKQDSEPKPVNPSGKGI